MQSRLPYASERVPMYGDQQPTPRRSRAFRKEATRERLATDGPETVSIETLRSVEPLDLEAEHWLEKNAAHTNATLINFTAAEVFVQQLK